MAVTGSPPGRPSGRGRRSRRPGRCRGSRRWRCAARRPGPRPASARPLGVALPGGGEPRRGPRDRVGEPTTARSADLPGGGGDVEVLLVPGAGGRSDGEGYDLHQRLTSSRARSMPTGIGSLDRSTSDAAGHLGVRHPDREVVAPAEEPGDAATIRTRPLAIRRRRGRRRARRPAVRRRRPAPSGAPWPRRCPAPGRTRPGSRAPPAAPSRPTTLAPPPPPIRATTASTSASVTGSPASPGLSGGSRTMSTSGCATAHGREERRQWRGRRLQLHGSVYARPDRRRNRRHRRLWTIRHPRRPSAG